MVKWLLDGLQMMRRDEKYYLGGACRALRVLKISRNDCERRNLLHLLRLAL